MQLGDLLTIGGASVIVSLLVQLVKPLLPARLVPLMALAIGVLIVGLAAVANVYAQAAGQAVLTGILAGAGAIGLYEVQAPVGFLRSKA